MKKKLEIILTSIHSGSAREVVTLGIDGKDSAQKFLLQLAKRDRKAFDSLKTRIRAVAEHDRYENQTTFRDLGDGIYEFKRNTPKLIRLYAFYDDADGMGKLIICTNGGAKGKQSADISSAKKLRKDYFKAKNESRKSQ